MKFIELLSKLKIENKETLDELSQCDKIDYLLKKILSGRNDSEYFSNLNSILELEDIKYKTIEDLESRITWLKSLDIFSEKIHLEKNHKEILEVFNALTNFFDGNKIEYYYTSGVLSYFLPNKKLERFHHDIDVFVNEIHLSKIEEIAEENGFSFSRIEGKRSDDTVRIMFKLRYLNIDIPITLFMYEKKNDYSIIQNDYYYKNETLMIEKTYNSPRIVELSFSKNKYNYCGMNYYSITAEALYLCKVGGRVKDTYDCNVMREIVNFALLDELKNELKIGVTVENKIVQGEFEKEIAFGKKGKVKRLVNN